MKITFGYFKTFAAFIVKNDRGEIIHIEFLPWILSSINTVIEHAIYCANDPCLRNASPSGHSMNAWRLHYKR